MWILCKPAGTTLAVFSPPPSLTCVLDGGAGTRPAVDGDVLSMQPDGKLIARPAGTNGDWEQVGISGGFASFNPAKTQAFIYAYATNVPGGYSAISGAAL
jgi:hypothetical protein